jgi:hypothetical protein
VFEKLGPEPTVNQDFGVEKHFRLDQEHRIEVPIGGEVVADAFHVVDVRLSTARLRGLGLRGRGALCLAATRASAHRQRLRHANRCGEVGGASNRPIKPATLIGLYPNPELKGVAQEVEATLVLIMNEAAG